MTIKLSVRNLVEFILQAGDIDNRRTSGQGKEAMQLGSKIHRKIQRRMGANYHSEVPLHIEVLCGEFSIRVEGRADGVISEDIGVVIDEIKGVLQELEYIQVPYELHLAQAKCYAYMYAKQEELSVITVQMTYCQMETEEIKQFRESFKMLELEEWFLAIVREYEVWARFKVEQKEIRNRSIKAIKFPYEYREGQKKLATSVYKTILRKKKLFIQAPTGVGKTMATVFPAVKAVGEGLGEKIFYLTAKTITRTVAEQAFGVLKEQGLCYKTITLTAKDKICFLEETNCNPEACLYAKGHYDRVNDAVYELLTTTEDMSREQIERHAKKHRVCPYETSLDLAIWVDAIICDYNYVFDPNTYLQRFFLEGISGEYLFLIDEAHNLVERGREMYSATLYKEEFLEVKRGVKLTDPALAKALGICNTQLLNWKRECETYILHESVAHFSLSLMNLMVEMERFLEQCEQEDIRDKVLDLYFKVRMFLNIHDRLDEHYMIYTEFDSGGSFKVKLLCVNPAKNLQFFLDKGNSTIFFSATLLPIQYYKKLLSMALDDYAIYVDSPFKVENRLLLLGLDVNTKYTMRTDDMYEKFAQYIIAAISKRKGNYIAFFPSYLFMNHVYEKLSTQLNKSSMIECIIQEQYMSEGERDFFLERFEEERKDSLLACCIMGGVFSEGIDLVGDSLIGAFIVGTGLPQVCNEREILKRYFDKRNSRGFDYAYLYPGMNKVLQAAGRVIRAEKDKGIIFLLDERFAQKQYKEIFPIEWNDYRLVKKETMSDKLEQFWGGEGKLL